MTSPRLTVREVKFFERDVRLRLPFRFGVITLREARQAFVRVRIAGEDGRESWGTAAEMLVPKWFDKDPTLSNEENVDHLRASVRLAAAGYRAAGAAPAFGLWAGHYEAQIKAGASLGMKPLVAGFGPALLDRAVMDALCRLHDVSFFTAMASNLAGMNAEALTPDLAGFDLDKFLADLEPRRQLHARHTVGLVDPLTAADHPSPDRLNDGLPETLEEVAATCGHRYYKLKVGGNVAEDVDRLESIAAVLDAHTSDYRITLDGNEQYQDADGVLALLDAMATRPSLDRLSDAILFIEQPIHRDMALRADVHAIAARHPVIIDESDGTIDAFPEARSRGYNGVSSKSCKGFYKSILNAARCAAWNAEAGSQRYFLSAEDLTCQAGPALQQDLALVALLGLEHVERNGHHYVRGMAGASDAEQASFLAAHDDLYRGVDGMAQLRIVNGEIALDSLHRPGFAIDAQLDFSNMRPMPQPSAVGT